MRADPRLQSALGDPMAGRREKTTPVAIAMTCGSAHHNLPHPIPIPAYSTWCLPAIGRWPRPVDEGVRHDCEAPWPPLDGHFQLGQAGIMQSFGEGLDRIAAAADVDHGKSRARAAPESTRHGHTHGEVCRSGVPRRTATAQLWRPRQGDREVLTQRDATLVIK